MTVTDIAVKRRDTPDTDQLQFTFARSAKQKVVLAAADRLKSVEGVRDISYKP